MPPMKPILTSLLALSLLSSLTALSSADLLPGTVYAASTNNAVIAVSKDKLLPLKWQVATDGMGMYDSKPPIMNGILYYSDINNTLYAKNIASGKVQWSYKQGRIRKSSRITPYSSSTIRNSSSKYPLQPES